MKYDFDEIVQRNGSNSYKWDSTEGNNIRPMWVADMDFKTAPAVREALLKRVEHGIFGYTKVPESYYEATISWFTRRHGWEISRNWFIYTSGVVPAISAIIKALTVPGDKVIVQPPVFNCFYSSIRNNDCTAVCNPLIYKDNSYSIDFADLETKAADNKVKLMILCNPHNPAGRVWSRTELERIGEICIRNGVTVISDEIHCELVFPGHKYIPFASISEEFRDNSVTCISPSKAFNIAGLQIANIVTSDSTKRAKIDKAININEVCDVNPFGVDATIAAYNEGEEWLSQLIDYLKGNYDYMCGYCATHIPEFPIVRLEGTYLAWMDCRVLNIKSKELENLLLKETGLLLNAGSMYGEAGEGFMRWNLACPRSSLQDGLDRFLKFVRKREGLL